MIHSSTTLDRTRRSDRHDRTANAAFAPGALRALVVALATWGALAPASLARAQSGIQVTPDGTRTLVSKDIGGQRWAITRNPDGSVTGNVFSPGGGAPQFVWCAQTASSEAGVDLACSGASACALAPCEADAWSFIASVTLPLSFFEAGAASTLAAIAAATTPTPMVHLALARPAGEAGSPPTGLQLTPDGVRTLLSKDVGDQRWAISRNEDGTVTGNVFFPGGGDPQFVWCEQTAAGRESVSLRCLGAPACARDGSQPCGGDDWTLIAEVTLPIDFFLPSEVLDQDAFVATLTADLGEDGAAAAVALALERGYSVAQIVDAAFDGRLRASGEIVTTGGTTEPPSGPALDLFADEPASGLALAQADGKPTLGAFLAKFKKDSVGGNVLILLLTLLDNGYSLEQVLIELFVADGKLTTVDGRLGIATSDGESIPPAGPPLFIFDKCGNGKRDQGERCEGTDFVFGEDQCTLGTGTVTCNGDCVPDTSKCLPSLCGNGVIDAGEECDGPLFSLPCPGVPDVPGAPRAVCSGQCKFNYSACPTSCATGGAFCCGEGKKRCGEECIDESAPCCGDGAREGSEQCDGGDLGGATCASQGQGSGPLRCGPTCAFDFIDCTGGGSCDPGTFPCEGGCAPNGADCCEGEQGYCAPGSVCVGNDACCPSGTPTVCGNQCLPAGASCCGNAVIEIGERCDGPSGCDEGETCDSCDECVAPQTCGNGVREGTETCDGADGCSAGQACSSGCDACTATQTCNNGIREGTEVCDPPGSTSACGAGEVCGADCASCVSTTSCLGRCCAGRNDSCTPPGVGCYCDEYCVEAGDCCGDFGASCG